jgi:FkbM family methyltransferase
VIKPIIIDCGGRRVEFFMDLEPGNIPDTAISWYLQQGIPPEPEVVHLMSRVVQEGDFVVDAGANVGFFTLLLSQYVGSSGAVLAVEPGSNNLPKLLGNKEKNKLNNIQFCTSPLAETAGMTQFHLSRDSGVNACWKNDTTVIESVEIQAVTLDTICIDTPKLIKMDIEGSELEALKGAEKLLQKHPPYIVLEFNVGALEQMGASPDAIRDFMRQRGYDLFVLSEHGLLPAMVPQFSNLQVTRNNTNVLFSTLDDVRKAWPEVIV